MKMCQLIKFAIFLPRNKHICKLIVLLENVMILDLSVKTNFIFIIRSDSDSDKKKP